MSMRRGQIFQFGKFQIDATARTLRREEATVKINSRAFDVLLYLVQNPGKALTRDELLKNAWADAFTYNDLDFPSASFCAALSRPFSSHWADFGQSERIPILGF